MKKTIKAPKVVDFLLRAITIISLLLLGSAVLTYFANGRDLSKINYYGYTMHANEGTSMLPVLDEHYTIHKKIDPDKIRLGDVISFTKYIEWEYAEIGITHRVVDFMDGGFITMGDGNSYIDEWIVYPEEVDGIVLYKIKGLTISKVKRKIIEHDKNIWSLFRDTPKRINHK